MRLFANLSIRAKLTAVISLLFWTISIFISSFFRAPQGTVAGNTLRAPRLATSSGAACGASPNSTQARAGPLSAIGAQIPLEYAGVARPSDVRHSLRKPWRKPCVIRNSFRLWRG
jgi:hypothetical protein